MVEIFSSADETPWAVARMVGRAENRKLGSPLGQIRDRLLGGHKAVRDSLLRGLAELGEDFQLNPPIRRGNRRSVGVLAGRRMVRDVLSGGHSVTLGPNYCISPRQDPEVFRHPHVRRLLVPSDWVANYWSSELPEIKGKVSIWSAGVDTNFWAPSHPNTGQPKALVYLKNQPENLVEGALDVLGSVGFEAEVITYGSYTPTGYRRALESARVVVWLGSSESQGIAQFEAWAMGVPIFARVSGRALQFPVGRSGYISVLREDDWSPAPYLSHQNGVFWKDWDDLRELCVSVRSGDLHFDPRAFVLKHHTIAHAAEKYLLATRYD